MDVIEKTCGVKRVQDKDYDGVYSGMPPFEEVDKPVSKFEFWPAFVFYIPVVFQWLWLSLRYRGIGLPLNANPSVFLSGMVGERKSELFSKATGEAKRKIAPWGLLEKGSDIEHTYKNGLKIMTEKGLNFPLVAKPDIGCRGAGVRVIRNKQQLLAYIQQFPVGESILLQKLAPYPAEAGIFYIRYPGTTKGEVFSLTLKYLPYVIGDGVSTLRELIENNPRANVLQHLYLNRHQNKLETIIPAGQSYQLAFAGSHSRGAIFRDGREYITHELAQSLDKICDGLPEFYYGRFDIKFRDVDSLMDGRNYIIVEVNGASSEAAHIWDCRGSLKEVFRVLFYQYRTLFHLGAINRRRGFKPASLWALFQAWKKERRLVTNYPETE